MKSLCMTDKLLQVHEQGTQSLIRQSSFHEHIAVKIRPYYSIRGQWAGIKLSYSIIYKVRKFSHLLHDQEVRKFSSTLAYRLVLYRIQLNLLVWCSQLPCRVTSLSVKRYNKNSSWHTVKQLYIYYTFSTVSQESSSIL